MLARLTAILLTAFLTAAIAQADTLWVGQAGQALELKNVTLNTISPDGKLLYQSAGRDASRELAVVVRIAIDDEPIFSGAEEAFAGGKFDLAANGYLTALHTTRRPWLTPRISTRLTELAQKGAKLDPNAVAQANAAAANPALAAPQRQAISTALAALPGGTAPSAGASAPAPAGALAAPSAAPASNALRAAAAAIKQNDFAGAIKQINTVKPSFTDPALQAQALMLLADAQSGLAAAAPSPAAWQDAAIAYMRVAAHFPTAAQAPAALLKVAQIERDKLNDVAAAQNLAQQTIQQYPSDPAAAEAAKLLQPKPAR